MATSPRRQGVGDPIGGGMHQFQQQQQQLHPAGVHHQQQQQQQHHNTQFNSAASAAGGMRHMVVQSDFRKVIDNSVTIFNLKDVHLKLICFFLGEWNIDRDFPPD